MSAELRQPERELARFQQRLLIAGVLIVIAFALLFGRFVYLQVFQHRHYAKLAQANRVDVHPEPPTRGIITDRNGIVLATNDSAYTLELNPRKTGDLERAIDEIASIIEITPRERRRFKRLYEEFRSAESLPLKTRLTDDEVARIVAQRYRLPGVEIKARLFRHYPFGETASHVLGYIGRISTADKEKLIEQNLWNEYKGSDYIGKVGLELSYERELRGRAGHVEVEVDAARRVVRTLSRQPARPGNHLQLSLDIRLQIIAERAFGARRGALVAIEPSSGEVLAFVSRPGFDPNLFVDGIDPQSWDALNHSPDKPLLNRPLRGTYPPGSTYKPFMALMALEFGLRSEHQTIHDPGYFRLGNTVWRDSRPGGHGRVDLPKSIAVSSDVYYYQLATELDPDRWAEFMRGFGFGVKTGIDLEGELPGILPDRAWKAKRFPKDPKLHIGDQVSMGIGQGFNTFTPLQLAYATSVLANRGVAFRPHLVRAIQDGTTGEWRLLQPQPAYTLNLKEAHLDAVVRGLVGVVQSGTAAAGFKGASYTSAGKTGTAQVFGLKGGDYIESRVAERLRDHSWYVVFAPVEKPRIAMAVFVENGGFGARAAVPIARQVLDAFFDPARLDAVLPANASNASTASLPTLHVASITRGLHDPKPHRP
ncbi:MAG: penicillin-binding protein 2 [Casimicrobiaceae bacterium]|nr:penicillin-binding protein 2 [Casimicrobiaceae bacterium]